MSLRLFNTLSRQLEEFVPSTPGFVGIYVCGPTVYSDAHLGHGKTAVAFDVIRRWFLYRGYRVRFVSNATDVGHITDSATDEGHDRVAERARAERVEPIEVADRYFWGYFEDMARLNVMKPDVTPRATGHIIEQIELIEELIERGLAYVVNGSVYFRVRAWPRYGQLSGRNIDELEAGTREAVRGEKEDPRDFALWKLAEPEHVQRWPSPWGDGFPGWHIECSAMSLKYLGEGFDIHGGGLDLQFPHHEAEIAQAEGAGHRFARYWLHSNMLTINGEKMSKSKGNFTTLKDFYRDHDPMVLRFAFVQAHYRSVSELSPESLAAAETALARLTDTRAELARRLETAKAGGDRLLEERSQAARAAFEAAMDNDFNTPEALAALFTFTRDVNAALSGSVGRDALEAALKVLDDLAGNVLGLFRPGEDQAGLRPELLEALAGVAIEARAGLRRNRNYAEADALRERLSAAGLLLEDTPEGTRWRLG
ncbi:MAG TPA: cysteine--tRNA ligase [Deinococcales bacterium]|nr:cysteine--tRNA ligase [Deinococcales bacterium]